MPLLNLNLSNCEGFEKTELLKAISVNLASLTGKPEHYVMVVLKEEMPIIFGGTLEPCCYIEIKSIGEMDNKKISEAICSLMKEFTGIEKQRIYIGFESIAPENWGYNGNTFG